VGDENNAAPFRRHPAKTREQLHGLLRSEDRGRLVEDKDARAAVKVLQDFHPLLLADRQLPDRTTRVHAHAVLVSEASDLAFELAPADERPRCVPAKRDVLGDREPVDEAEVLVHHADSAVNRVPRRVQIDDLAPNGDRPRVRMQEPGEDVHHRCLAGAVLPQESVNLPPAKVEIDAVVGAHARKLLDDPAELDERLLAHARESKPRCACDE
jgi:hypothetical protein